MRTFSTKGIIRYGTDKVYAEIDQGVVDFYYWLIPKALGVKRQKYPAHVSVVRHEKPPNMAVWGDHAGEVVVVEYAPTIRHDARYYWLDAQCDRLKEIRKGLGLAEYPWWRNRFHITLGNVKSP